MGTGHDSTVSHPTAQALRPDALRGPPRSHACDGPPSSRPRLVFIPFPGPLHFWVYSCVLVDLPVNSGAGGKVLRGVTHLKHIRLTLHITQFWLDEEFFLLTHSPNIVKLGQNIFLSPLLVRLFNFNFSIVGSWLELFL